MNLFRFLTSNYIINVGFCAWMSAQLLKVLLTLLVTHKLDLERFVGAGGMPSSHSAMTSSIAIAMARKMGFASPEFGLALAFAAIVMYDAMGVRRAAGEQAKVLNKMIFEFSFPFFHRNHGDSPQAPDDGDAKEDAEEEISPEAVQDALSSPILDKELKEFLGHTPMEVLGGCLLGILISIFLPVV